jgi:hypothetical protein
MHTVSSKETSVSVIDFETLSPVPHSTGGVLYLPKPGVALLARPNVHLGALTGFLGGFDLSLHCGEYMDDPT